MVNREMDNYLNVGKLLDNCATVLEEHGKTFTLTFQIWRFALENLSEEQINEILVEKPFIKDKKTFFDNALNAWAGTISETLTKKTTTLMVKHPISQGEALLAADHAYEQQIGYIQSFVYAIIINTDIIEKIETTPTGKILKEIGVIKWTTSPQE